MSFNLNSFTHTIEENWETDMNKMCDNILSYAADFCPLSPDMETALTLVAKESYLAALKTIEQAITASFE